ncbi:hypothetical protein, partial [Capnocytophaga bilenii]|uniref:hypothetical protein n=1 Tax=Capnocytophaga bilenii TaxID=2819369 RepID=UPI0028D4F8BB
MLIEIFYLKIVFANNRFLNCASPPRWRELVARAYHNSLYNQCAPHFGKLSEFDKVLSFGASRTGFYPLLNLRSTFAQGSLGVYAPHFG